MVLEKMFIIQESKRLAKSELKRANWKLGFRFSFADLKILKKPKIPLNTRPVSKKTTNEP